MVTVRTTRRYGVLALLLGALALAAAASVAFGSKSIDLGSVAHALLSPTGTEDDSIVRELRLPRTGFAIAVGMALGIGGALIQGHTRNPLADPGILGINQGAGFAVVLAISLLGVTSPLGYVWFAFAGALAASVVVFLLGSGRNGPTPVTLALAGAAVSALLQGLISGVVLSDRQSLDSFRFWQVGSVEGRDVEVLWQVLPFLVVGLVLAAFNAPGLNALSLGDEVARSLGQNVNRTRALGIGAITLLVGGSVAACGPIGFLGLVVPHAARAVTGPDHRWLLPVAGLMGGVLLLVADVLGRVVARPGELEVGIVMALVGAPFFVALVRRRNLVKL
ncbi:iron ABC transporter permease [Actinosynnema pretiosum subsp. pretiosum]|uniref:Transport system permease protein n=2 Tax=Actinosynnema TaxID=40566 RepID=C6WGI4_ACTMD|nr:transport system permease protein [Actinosynnema mirum DSM 43827]AXX27675.1 ABC-type Fe3+-siderophore transport system, permease component [Actinosynnema pretiosum subsp. pretiosum]QUF01625.1 iron ABC transporter permease [Actinosynnema pretiosum subsp. pretiosum]